MCLYQIYLLLEDVEEDDSDDEDLEVEPEAEPELLPDEVVDGEAVARLL